MFDKIVEISGVDAATLKREIRDVHRKHGTSEYAFLLEELPSLHFPGENREELLERFSPAIEAFRIARRETLELYPGVLETLVRLKDASTMIVAYTESLAFYSNYRIRKLGLDGILDFMFSPEDHDLPDNLEPTQIRKYPAAHYELKTTKHLHTPKGELKPNPHILLDITSKIGASPSDCLYIGDSLFKDVAMAQDAGVDDVWAKYGTAQMRPEYQLLRDVTHWTNAQVEHEKRVKERDVMPSYILDHNFRQILSYFDFGVREHAEQ